MSFDLRDEGNEDVLIRDLRGLDLLSCLSRFGLNLVLEEAAIAQQFIDLLGEVSLQTWELY